MPAYRPASPDIMPLPSTSGPKRRGAIPTGKDKAAPDWDAGSAEYIHTPKLSHIVADRLRRQIVTGELKAGDSLAPENQLTEQFGISRPALREALRVLEAESLISVGRGTRSGATILKPPMDSVVRYGIFYLIASGTTLREIHDARTLIEPAVVRQLTEHPNPEHIAKLRACNAAARQALAAHDIKQAMLGGSQFHKLLALFAENKALGLLVGMLHDLAVMNYVAVDKMGKDDTTRQRVVSHWLELQDKLVSHIEQGEPERAAQFWRECLSWSNASVLTKTGQDNEAVQLKAP